MNLSIKGFEEISLRGIYCIRNIKSGKRYIGSASITISKRLQNHYRCLIRNDHKNQHLQRAWNKYGESSFIFEVIENCPRKECLVREQYWIDYYKKEGIELYNINEIATGTTGMSEEVIRKRSDKIRVFHDKCSEYYKQYRDNQIEEEDIPTQYRKMVRSYIVKEPWNKGKKYESTDHLKIPKKTGDNTKRLETLRSKLPEIEVYTEMGEYIGKWKNTIELTQESMTEGSIIREKMKLRNPDGRNGLNPYILQGVNINKSATYGKPYKGLLFKQADSSGN